MNPNRRNILKYVAAMPVLVAASPVVAAVRTPSATEGPYYPTQRMRFADADNDLVKIEGVVKQAGGEFMHLKGRVLDRQGRPARGARVEIWQCDVGGRYLHRGDADGRPRDASFQGFGHYVTKGNGAYTFRTIKPVPYTGRAPHIHVKVIHGGRELTTQFYLAGHPQNRGDFLFRRMPAAGQRAVSMVVKQGVASVDIRL